jgi:hypothetical protein
MIGDGEEVRKIAPGSSVFIEANQSRMNMELAEDIRRG